MGDGISYDDVLPEPNQTECFVDICEASADTLRKTLSKYICQVLNGDNVSTKFLAPLINRALSHLEARPVMVVFVGQSPATAGLVYALARVCIMPVFDCVPSDRFEELAGLSVSGVDTTTFVSPMIGL